MLGILLPQETAPLKVNPVSTTSWGDQPTNSCTSTATAMGRQLKNCVLGTCWSGQMPSSERENIREEAVAVPVAAS